MQFHLSVTLVVCDKKTIAHMSKRFSVFSVSVFSVFSTTVHDSSFLIPIFYAILKNYPSPIGEYSTLFRWLKFIRGKNETQRKCVTCVIMNFH